MGNIRAKVFGIIGICLDSFTIAIGLYVWSIVAQVDYLTEPNSFFLFDFLLGMIMILSYIILIFGVISLFCLILASFALKKLQSDPKLSGYLFLIAGGFGGLVNIYFMIIGSYLFLPIQPIIYLIAGILCLRSLRSQLKVKYGVKLEVDS